MNCLASAESVVGTCVVVLFESLQPDISSTRTTALTTDRDMGTPTASYPRAFVHLQLHVEGAVQVLLGEGVHVPQQRVEVGGLVLGAALRGGQHFARPGEMDVGASPPRVVLQRVNTT